MIAISFGLEKFVSDAIKDRDTKVLNALLGAPAALSGLTKQMQAHHLRTFHEMTQPEVAARLSVMRKALEIVDRNGHLIFGEVSKALGADWETVKKLRKASSAAEQSLLLVNAAPVQS